MVLSIDGMDDAASGLRKKIISAGSYDVIFEVSLSRRGEKYMEATRTVDNLEILWWKFQTASQKTVSRRDIIIIIVAILRACMEQHSVSRVPPVILLVFPRTRSPRSLYELAGNSLERDRLSASENSRFDLQVVRKTISSRGGTTRVTESGGGEGSFFLFFLHPHSGS